MVRGDQRHAIIILHAQAALVLSFDRFELGFPLHQNEVPIGKLCLVIRPRVSLVHVVDVGYVLLRRLFVVHDTHHVLFGVLVAQREHVEHVARIHLKFHTVLVEVRLNALALLLVN